MKINEIANTSTVDEEWYNPLTWFKKKPRATTKAVANNPEVKTVSPDLMPGDGLANQAANHIANNKNKKAKALADLKKEMGTESDHTISSRQNYNLSDKGGKQKTNYTQHIRDYEHGKGLSTLTTAQQHDGSTSSRFIMPGGSGVETKNGVEKKIQMKGPQSWAYDKPKLNASKKVKEEELKEFGPDERYTKIGNNTMIANKKTGSVSSTLSLGGDKYATVNNHLNKDGSAGKLKVSGTLGGKKFKASNQVNGKTPKASVNGVNIPVNASKKVKVKEEEVNEHEMGLLRNVARQMEADAHAGDYTAIEELLHNVSTEELEAFLSDHRSPDWTEESVKEYVQEPNPGQEDKFTGQEINFIHELCLRHDGVERDPAGLKYLGKSELWDGGNIIYDKVALAKLMLWVKKNKDDVEKRFSRMFKNYSNKDENGKVTASDGNQILLNINSKIGTGEVAEGDMEADKTNPHAQPYLNTPEWKMLHDMNDKIIMAYIKHKSIARAAGRGLKKGLKKLSKIGSKHTSSSSDGTTNTTYGMANAKESELNEFTLSDLKGMGIKPTREQFHKLQKINHENGGNITRSDLQKVGINEQGVIVPGVNTTIDVKPGQTEIEAAKFGNGKIKPLMPKGKSSSHILFNLGLAEKKIIKK